MTLASIQKIIKIDPIEQADNIEVATVLGWKVVVRKGEFQVDDPCIYVEIDSILPERPEFEFLRPRGFRIRTVKLRGQVSQGIVFPLDILKRDNVMLGEDVTDELGIVKYEKPLPNTGEFKAHFPKFIPRTDEPRIQSYPQILTRYSNVPFYVTEKLDGTSFTVYRYGNDVEVCNRSKILKLDGEHAFGRMFKKLELDRLLREKGENIALQGELVGPGIQGNRLKLKENAVFFFNGYYIDHQRYLDFIQLETLLTELGLKMVPILYRKFYLPETISELEDTFNEDDISVVGAGRREGVVIRSVEEKIDPEIGRLSFKVVSPRYLLKHGE